MIRHFLIHFSLLLSCVLSGLNLNAKNESLRLPKYTCICDDLVTYLDSLVHTVSSDYGVIDISRNDYEVFSLITIQLFQGDYHQWREYGMIQNTSIPIYLSGDMEMDLFQRTKGRIKTDRLKCTTLDEIEIDDSNLIAVVFDKIQLFEFQNDFTLQPISAQCIRNKYPYIIYDNNGRPIFETAYEMCGNEVKRFCKYYLNGKTVKAELLKNIDLHEFGQSSTLDNKISAYVFYNPDTADFIISNLGIMDDTQENNYNDVLHNNKESIIKAINSKHPSVVRVIY